MTHFSSRILIFIVMTLLFFAPFFSKTDSDSWDKLKGKYQAAIASCMKNSNFISEGSVSLPPEFKELSIDGFVIITKPENYIIFRTDRGRGNNFSGYLFSDLQNFNNNDQVSVLTWAPNNLQRVEVKIVRKCDEKWYFISTGYND